MGAVLALSLPLLYVGTLPAYAATLTLSPAGGPAGTVVRVTGAGYVPKGEVRVYFDSTVPNPDRRLASTTATDSGAISVMFVVPNVFSTGSLTVTACSVEAGTENCLGREPFAKTANPFPRLIPGQGEANTMVTVSAERYAAPSACGPIRVLFDGASIGTIPPNDADGDFSFDGTGSFTIPNVPVGTYPVEVSQTDNGCKVLEMRSYDVLAFTLSPASGRPGAAVTGTGAGFHPDVVECGQVAISFDGMPVGSVSPDAEGRFTVSFSAPDRPPGTYVVVANQGRTCGVGGDIQGDEPFTIEPASGAPALAVDPNVGRSGQRVKGKGQGFTRELPLVLEFEGARVADAAASSAVFDTPTTFLIDFTVPTRPPGVYPVDACQPDCRSARLRARATFEVVAGPTLALDPAEGPIGTRTNVIGSGFERGQNVELRLLGILLATVPGGDMRDSGFSVELTIPPGVAGGDRPVRACQRCGTAAERSAEATFKVTPRLFVQPGIGPPGLVAVADGDGFPADSEIRLTWRPGIGGVDVPADKAGTFRAPVLVFRKDVTGPRELVATPSGTPQETAPTAPFLVVAGTQQPKGFISRR